MKRICLGLGILAVLLSTAVLFTVAMNRIYKPIAKNLLSAAQAASGENWSKAEELASAANDGWEQYRNLSAALADHSPMDDIDGLFAELETYLQQREMPHFSATCLHLAKLTESMGDNHAFSWWNFL